MEILKIYTVIPYFSDGVEVNQNEVKSFTQFEDASRYANEFNRVYGSHFDIVESELITHVI